MRIGRSKWVGKSFSTKSQLTLLGKMNLVVFILTEKAHNDTKKIFSKDS